MEPHVGRQKAPHQRAIERLFARCFQLNGNVLNLFAESLQHRNIVGANAPRGERDGEAFQPFSQFIQIDNVASIRDANDRPAPRRPFNEAFDLQLLNRFADRRSADAEHFGEHRFGNLASRRQTA